MQSVQAIFRFVVLAAMLFCFVRSDSHASRLSFPTLAPKTYQSLSGEYLLSVKPGNPNGSGKANYRVTKGGVEIWAGEKPFTLWDARLSDKGEVAGYAYSSGLYGFARENEKNDFIVLILDSLGNPRLQQAVPRKFGRHEDAPDNPNASGIVLDTTNDRFIVRVADPNWNRGIETWWVYRLSTGEKIKELEPQTKMVDVRPDGWKFQRSPWSIIHAEPIPGTPFILLHWVQSHSIAWPDWGARFSLVDLKGSPVWTLEWPRDYNVQGVPDTNMGKWLREEGPILDVSRPRRFDLYCVAERKRVSFSVSKGDNGTWNVEEIGRKDYEMPGLLAAVEQAGVD